MFEVHFGWASEHAQKIAAHSSVRATKLYDRRADETSLNRATFDPHREQVGAATFESERSQPGLLLDRRCGPHPGRADWTVREWCRLGRVHVEKRVCGRGSSKEWMLSHDELQRIKAEGLLPITPYRHRVV